MSNSNKTKIACLAVLFFLVTAGVSFSHLLFEGSVDVKPSGFESREILLYYGHGGTYPGFWGNGVVDFFELQARYDGQGCPTTYTDLWPVDLNEYRVIFLILPGYLDDSGTYYFTSGEINQLKAFLTLGGRLVVQGDHSGIFGVNTVNNLLTNLGVGIFQNSDNVLDDSDPPPTDITADQLTDGVSALDMGGSGVSTLALAISGTGKSLVRSDAGETLVAVDQIPGSPSRPGADVIVYGDTQVLDDYQLQDKDGNGPYSNFVFADNIGMCYQSQPPVANAGPDQTVNEGDTVNLDGSASVGSVTYPPIDPGVIALWHMNEGSGVMVYDSTTYGNDGSRYGASWDTGKFGQGLTMDGTNDYVKVNHDSSQSLTDEITVEAWIKPEPRVDDEEKHIVNKWMGADIGGWFRTGYGFFFGDVVAETDELVVTLGFGSSQWASYKTTTLDGTWITGKWYHVAFTFDMDGGPNNLKIYRDGQLEAQFNENRSIAANSIDLYIGRNNPNDTTTPGNPFLDGGVDEVLIWKRALSTVEIQGYYNSGKEHFAPTQNQIISYEWDFESDGVYDYQETPSSAPDGAFDGMTTHVYSDNAVVTVTLRITDASGAQDTDTATVTVLNVDPTVKNGLEEKKIKEIPVPWQRWRMGVNGVVDIIFLPDVREPVAIVRDFVVLQREIELDNLTWVETQKLPWQPIDDPTVPFILGPNEEVEYFIPVTEDDGAVLVRYSVAWASSPDIIEANFINEAILESKSPQVIVGSLSNFDVHNDYNETIDNFELELYGDIRAGYVLYGHDNVNHNIIQIDRTTGHATVVGPTGFDSGASGMATSRGAVPGPGGVTFPAGTHFGLFRDNTLGVDFVVAVDVSTGTATKVVQTSRLIGGRGIAFGSDGVTLYVIEGDGSLSTIDVVTGSVSLVGNTGHAFDNIQWDPSSWGFYGISGNTLYKINPGTAVATAVLAGGLGAGFSACTLTRSPVGAWYTVNSQAKTLVTVNINTGTISGVVGNLGPHASSSICGTVFELSDILYVYDPAGPPVLVSGWLGPTWYGGWGAPPVLIPLPGGVEIKWIDQDHPVVPCEWIHFGLALSPSVNLTGARAYLTQILPVPTHMKEEKVKAIPVPWQKWRMEVNGVTDIIFFDPPAMPFDAVALVRDFVVLDYEIPLDDLTWVGTENLSWTPVDDPKNPYILNLNEEVELFIPTTEDDRAVLVRYSVAWANTPSIIEAHFVNEAILESKSPQAIVGWLSNFDVHNDYNDTIDNFELEFYGNITPSDILYVYDPAGPPVLVPGWLGPTWYGGWGAPPLINSIPGGIEMKWVDLDHPVQYCEWIHFGVSLRPEVFLTGAKAYLTQMVPVPVYTVDEGKPVTLIAYATDPGSDDLTFTWSWGDGTPDTVTTYFNNGASPDPYPSYWYGTYPFSATDVARHVYADDGHYDVTLTVTDDDGGGTVSYKQVVVKNVPPTVDIDYTVVVNEPRTVGYWGHQCTVETPYGDHTGILQEWIDAISAQSLVFSGISTKQQVCDIVQETDRNDMLIMAKRQLMGVWLNVVSGKLHPMTPVNMPSLTNSTTVMQAITEMENILLTTTDRDEQERAKDIADNMNNGIGIVMVFGGFIGTATDPGADDLLLHWDFDDGTTMTTFYPNPGGVFPFTVVETVWHTFPGSGTYNVTLTATDDEGGVGVATAVVVIP